jgi:hypothetical protein
VHLRIPTRIRRLCSEIKDIKTRSYSEYKILRLQANPYFNGIRPPSNLAELIPNFLPALITNASTAPEQIVRIHRLLDGQKPRVVHSPKDLMVIRLERVSFVNVGARVRSQFSQSLNIAVKQIQLLRFHRRVERVPSSADNRMTVRGPPRRTHRIQRQRFTVHAWTTHLPNGSAL